MYCETGFIHYGYVYIVSHAGLAHRAVHNI